MSKYWRQTNPITPEEINTMKFKDWHETDTAPRDGRFIMGRLEGTTRARAVRWNKDCDAWCDDAGRIVAISQWISFTDFADIRECVWRQG